MEKKTLIIVGVEVPQSIIDKAKAEYPDYEVIVVDSPEAARRAVLERKVFEKPSTPITAMPKFEEPIKDLKFHTPWPEPHKSSRRNKKF